ncbi:hypothetical protein NQ317_006218 [Molorchus minor]|uniref:Uncharacterized protein n=1 Tax=Molorchus minor TaxID=1323400 RepID=A0ABQ9K736_9CUCU|nr:hypothetical protein NQ317_006218 [Molorchus minor]
MNDRQWSDIGYNFFDWWRWEHLRRKRLGHLRCPCTQIQLQKYWNLPDWKFSREYNIFLVHFRSLVNSPPENQLQALKDLVSCGVEQGKIVSNLHLIGHRQGGTTQCPGDKLYNYVKTDTQWDPNPN